jgi:flagellar biosynthetic protein FliP
VNPVGSLLGAGGGQLTPSLKILAIFTVLSLLPALVMTTTSFVRTVVVLSFVRQGIGSQQTPPTQVLVGLSLFLTLFTMTPVARDIENNAFTPYMNGTISDMQAAEAAAAPLRTFMLRQTRQKDLQLFFQAAQIAVPATPEEVPMRIAVPAFVISELTTSFQMGVMVLLPFLVVDLAISSLLMSMGMVFVSPNTISLPVKLLLFVLVDGWNLVVDSILRSFR